MDINEEWLTGRKYLSMIGVISVDTGQKFYRKLGTIPYECFSVTLSKEFSPLRYYHASKK